MAKFKEFTADVDVVYVWNGAYILHGSISFSFTQIGIIKFSLIKLYDVG